MPESIQVLSAFNSVLEVAVAFNFAYAASSQVRDTVKSGFLEHLRSLHANFEFKIRNIKAEIGTSSDDGALPKSGDISSEDRNHIIERLDNNVGKMVLVSDELLSDIDSEQHKLTGKYKSIYVFIALMALFWLILGGQEGYHGVFPRNEIIISLGFTSCFLVIQWASGYAIPVISSTVIAVLSIVTSLFLASYATDKVLVISDKMLVNMVLLLSFLPFILSSLAMFLISYKLQIKYWLKALSFSSEADTLMDQVIKQKDAKQYLKKYAAGATHNLNEKPFGVRVKTFITRKVCNLYEKLFSSDDENN